MKFRIKKSRSFFRKIGSCASYASYASYASCASHAYYESESRRMFGIKTMGMNTFHHLRTPSTACGRSPSLDEGGLGFRRSRPSALPPIGYRGFAVAPITLRASSRRFSYNPGCRVATLLVSMGVMGFLGDLRGRNSKSPPNPLGLAERVPSSADDDSPSPKRQQYNPQLQMHLMAAIPRNLVRVTNSFHRLRAVPLPRGGRSGGAGKD